MDGIGQSVEEDLHLAADVINIDGRTEDDRVCFPHPGYERGDVITKDAGPAQRTGFTGSAGRDTVVRKVNHLGF
jgi:hypothetical protein